MNAKLRLVVLPDAVSINRDAILRATLLFDEIYLGSFIPKIINDDSLKSDSLIIQFSPWIPNEDKLLVLKEAGIIKPVTNEYNALVPEFSSRKLSIDLRNAIANSLKNGTSLCAACFLNFLSSHKTNSSNFKLPYKYYVNDPASLDNPLFELAICLHLTSIFHMLNMCLNYNAYPLVDNSVHANLLSKLISEFSSLAEALKIKDVDTTIKQETVALRILESTLPNIKVNHPEDILYLRDELKDELSVFRTEIGKLSTTLKSRNWDDNIENEIHDIILRDVNPAIEQLNLRLTKPSKRIIKHLVNDWSAIFSSAVVPLTALLLKSACTPWAILGGISTGLGISAIKAKVEEWSVKSESSFAFLFEVKKRYK